MTTDVRPQESAGGDGLLFVIVAATVTVVTAECALIAYASWWLLVVVLAAAILATFGVVTALIRLMDHDTPIALPQRPEPEPGARPAAAPRRHPVASH